MGLLDMPRHERWAWKLSTSQECTSTAVVNVYSEFPSGTSANSAEDSSVPCAALQFLDDSFTKGVGLVKLLLPLESGYVVQSDFLHRRMVDCLRVSRIQSFVTPGQHLQGHSGEAYQSMCLERLLACCYGSIAVCSDDSPSITTESMAIDDELISRLSFQWLSPNPIPRKRLALVGAGSLPKVKGYMTAAASLNIAMVVFDESSHWMSGEAYGHLCEAFIPLDMTVDAGLTHRIARALSDYQQDNREERLLHGVISVDEHLHTIIAHVAEHLGFPTSPSGSVALAQNKYQTRQLDSNIFCRLIRSQAELGDLLSEDGPHLPYPLIVKPSRGWSSEGVWKVENEQELCEKVALLWRESFITWHGRDVVIETYVDGPEVDANMVLVDGKVVFFEVNDDYPCAGDYKDSERGARVANFVETSNMLPSALPPSELGLLQQRLHELALSAGFQNAILHIEAKLQNSSYYYGKDADADGLVDLQFISPTKIMTQPKDVFLLEINPRAPGWQEVEATARAYGVSYYSISLLNALADKDRIMSLCKPFVGGAQYHMQLLFVSAQKGGVYEFGDICSTVLKADSPTPGNKPQRLGDHVVECANLMEDGEEVLDPSTGQVYGNFIAFFLVVSRTSRKEAMRIGRDIESIVREHTGGF